ncbi:MAG TPA: diacylglycerol kinase family protein [Flavobacteriaceae bacterium]|nr:diacylglycerol kinase family protein [Flavobacteriaceae bacterium]
MKNTFISNRLRAFIYAFRGAYLLLKTEASIQAQAFIALLTIIAGWYFKINTTEWMCQLLAIGMVLGTEGVNTAIEKLCDFIHPEHHERIGFIKDVAAGAVFFVALVAVAIGLFIYVPKIYDLLSS